MNLDEHFDLPGHELVAKGIEDLSNGVFDSVEALLVAVGAPRLRGLGLNLPFTFSVSPEHDLYFRLGLDHEDSAHSQYNACIRRLVSFERALTHRIWQDRSDNRSSGVSNG